MPSTLSSEARDSENVIFTEQKSAAIPQSFLKKGDTFTCL